MIAVETYVAATGRVEDEHGGGSGMFLATSKKAEGEISVQGGGSEGCVRVATRQKM
jgi:hypothetical protein